METYLCCTQRWRYGVSFYADYIAEHTHGEVIETDRGFVTYVFTPENTCYIQEIYVAPRYRKSGAGGDFLAQIEGLAKQRGCKKVLGSVVPSAKGSTISLKVLLAVGFKLESSSADFILMNKEIVA